MRAIVEGAFDGILVVDVQVNVEGPRLQLPIGVVLPCGMVLVELVTNVLKHAYPDGRPGEAVVRLAVEAGRVTLIVRDTDVGLPDDFDPEAAGTFGWQLIRNLTVQIGGTTVIERSGGTCVTVSFPYTATA